MVRQWGLILTPILLTNWRLSALHGSQRNSSCHTIPAHWEMGQNHPMHQKG